MAEAVDRWGRVRTHPDFEREPPLAHLLTQGLGDADWRLADDTLSHAFVSAARRVEVPKPTVVYEIMSHSDRRCCFVVVRRFSDFVALAADIRKELFFLEEFVELLPEVPSTFLSFLTTETDPQSRFVQERKQALERYLKELMGVGALNKSRSFRRFMLDRVYMHEWGEPGAAPADLVALRSGVAIETTDFRAASQRVDQSSDADAESSQWLADEDVGADSSGRAPEVQPRITEEELLQRRAEEERRLSTMAQPQPQPQPQTVATGGGDGLAATETPPTRNGAPGTISEGDPTLASQQRREERAAQRQRQRQQEKGRDREKKNEKEKEKEKEMDKENEKER